MDGFLKLLLLLVEELLSVMLCDVITALGDEIVGISRGVLQLMLLMLDDVRMLERFDVFLHGRVRSGMFQLTSCL